ncbi:hypothetical protein WJX84_005848 [Apatococcus fuscideae]|uniref:Uncharacterized protein n=1 Tax=Apatococcus fuscideae TaxID=2026836 RepID=A0AAW1SVL2_9CHLO
MPLEQIRQGRSAITDLALGLQQNLEGFQQSACASRARLQQSLSQQQQQSSKRDLERIYGKSDPLAALIPGNSVAEQVLTSGFSSTLSLYNTAIIGRLLLTWFPNPPAAIANPLSTLCDPYLNLFRGLIPPIGGTLDCRQSWPWWYWICSPTQQEPCQQRWVQMASWP